MEEKLNILLIEDDIVDAKNFKRILDKTSLSNDFKHVNNTDEGFELIQNEVYDIVFMDYHMPRGNGLALLKAVRNVGVSVPIVIITSYADPKVAVEMMQAGASDYIPKSLLNVDGLSQCIRNSLRYSDLDRRKKETETQLKKVENRLGTIISHTPIILFALDQNGMFKLGLGKFWDVFKPESSNIIGQSIYDVYVDYPVVVNSFKESLNGRVQKITTTINYIIFDITFTPLRDKNNEVKEILGLALDITDRAKGEENLLKAKEIAERTSRMKQEFIANMSHEIRTPMNAIVGFTNLLKDTSLNDLQKDFVDSIKVSGENLLSLINDILDFSKIEAGKLTLEKEVFNINEVLKAVYKVLDGKAKEKKLRLILEVSDDIPTLVQGDPTRLYQILINLAGNSIKFTNKGWVEIRAEVKKITKQKVILNFTVEDTGIGIPDEMKGRIFQSFTQVSGAKNRKYGGTGLGLTIVKNLLDLMGGDIKVKSREEEGTIFEFTLPYSISSELESKSEEVVANEDVISNLKGKRILLAEDNAMNQKLVIMYLKKYDVQIDLAENGVQAIKAVKANDYDLVLMDIQMPEMDGLEATRLIRTEFPPEKKDIPIVAMTAHAFKEEVEKCLEIGMNAHISKPIDKNIFLKLIYQFTNNVRVPEVNNNVKPSEEEVEPRVVVDLTYLRQMAEGSEGFVEEMIKIFMEDAPELIGKMKEAYSNKDWKALSKVAHKFRSPAVMMGMKSVAEITEKIEYDALDEQNLEKMEERINKVESESQEAVEFIKNNF